MNRPVTTIRWRPYPEEKPPEGDETYLVMEKDRMGEMGQCYYDGAAESDEAQWIDVDGGNAPVTHFALPEDITTVQPPVTNNKGEEP